MSFINRATTDASASAAKSAAGTASVQAKAVINEKNFDVHINAWHGIAFLKHLKTIKFEIWQLIANADDGKKLSSLKNDDQKKFVLSEFNKFYISYEAAARKRPPQIQAKKPQNTYVVSIGVPTIFKPTGPKGSPERIVADFIVMFMQEIAKDVFSDVTPFNNFITVLHKEFEKQCGQLEGKNIVEQLKKLMDFAANNWQKVTQIYSDTIGASYNITKLYDMVCNIKAFCEHIVNMLISDSVSDYKQRYMAKALQHKGYEFIQAVENKATGTLIIAKDKKTGQTASFKEQELVNYGSQNLGMYEFLLGEIRFIAGEWSKTISEFLKNSSLNSAYHKAEEKLKKKYGEDTDIVKEYFRTAVRFAFGLLFPGVKPLSRIQRTKAGEVKSRLSEIIKYKVENEKADLNNGYIKISDNIVLILDFTKKNPTLKEIESALWDSKTIKFKNIKTGKYITADLYNLPKNVHKYINDAFLEAQKSKTYAQRLIDASFDNIIDAGGVQYVVADAVAGAYKGILFDLPAVAVECAVNPLLVPLFFLNLTTAEGFNALVTDFIDTVESKDHTRIGAYFSFNLMMIAGILFHGIPKIKEFGKKVSLGVKKENGTLEFSLKNLQSGQEILLTKEEARTIINELIKQGVQPDAIKVIEFDSNGKIINTPRKTFSITKKGETPPKNNAGKGGKPKSKPPATGPTASSGTLPGSGSARKPKPAKTQSAKTQTAAKISDFTKKIQEAVIAAADQFNEGMRVTFGPKPELAVAGGTLAGGTLAGDGKVTDAARPNPEIPKGPEKPVQPEMYAEGNGGGFSNSAEISIRAIEPFLNKENRAIAKNIPAKDIDKAISENGLLKKIFIDKKVELNEARAEYALQQFLTQKAKSTADILQNILLEKVQNSWLEGKEKGALESKIKKWLTNLKNNSDCFSREKLLKMTEELEKELNSSAGVIDRIKDLENLTTRYFINTKNAGEVLICLRDYLDNVLKMSEELNLGKYLDRTFLEIEKLFSDGKYTDIKKLMDFVKKFKNPSFVEYFTENISEKDPSSLSAKRNIFLRFLTHDENMFFKMESHKRKLSDRLREINTSLKEKGTQVSIQLGQSFATDILDFSKEEIEFLKNDLNNIFYQKNLVEIIKEDYLNCNERKKINKNFNPRQIKALVPAKDLGEGISFKWGSIRVELNGKDQGHRIKFYAEKVDGVIKVYLLEYYVEHFHYDRVNAGLGRFDKVEDVFYKAASSAVMEIGFFESLSKKIKQYKEQFNLSEEKAGDLYNEFDKIAKSKRNIGTTDLKKILQKYFPENEYEINITFNNLVLDWEITKKAQAKEGKIDDDASQTGRQDSSVPEVENPTEDTNLQPKKAGDYKEKLNRISNIEESKREKAFEEFKKNTPPEIAAKLFYELLEHHRKSDGKINLPEYLSFFMFFAKPQKDAVMSWFKKYFSGELTEKNKKQYAFVNNLILRLLRENAAQFRPGHITPSAKPHYLGTGTFDDKAIKPSRPGDPSAQRDYSAKDYPGTPPDAEENP